jgi:hypothetical protein
MEISSQGEVIAPKFCFYASIKTVLFRRLSMKSGDNSRTESTFIWNAALIVGLMAGIAMGSGARWIHDSALAVGSALDSHFELSQDD